MNPDIGRRIDQDRVAEKNELVWKIMYDFKDFSLTPDNTFEQQLPFKFKLTELRFLEKNSLTFIKKIKAKNGQLSTAQIMAEIKELMDGAVFPWS